MHHHESRTLEHWTAVALSGLLAIALAGCGEDQPPSPEQTEGPAERMGKQLDAAMEKAGEQAEAAMSQASERIDASMQQAGENIDTTLQDAKAGLATAADEAARRLEATSQSLEETTEEQPAGD
ncbi:hypothetical protein [Thiorhodococcus minor]|uniref:hypothetical protein n=1 Tax=Thiorhodococcus minor TaxID=57489 RepID=UPI001ADB08BC|nr:hypothetical protein [Thiorhodococcus minor]